MAVSEDFTPSGGIVVGMPASPGRAARVLTFTGGGAGSGARARAADRHEREAQQGESGTARQADHALDAHDEASDAVVHASTSPTRERSRPRLQRPLTHRHGDLRVGGWFVSSAAGCSCWICCWMLSSCSCTDRMSPMLVALARSSCPAGGCLRAGVRRACRSTYWPVTSMALVETFEVLPYRSAA